MLDPRRDLDLGLGPHLGNVLCRPQIVGGLVALEHLSDDGDLVDLGREFDCSRFVSGERGSRPVSSYGTLDLPVRRAAVDLAAVRVLGRWPIDTDSPLEEAR